MGTVDHADLAEALSTLSVGQTQALGEVQPHLATYLGKMQAVSPDTLTPAEAKAYWLNVYNAGALQLAGAAMAAGRDSVLRVPGGFQATFVTVDGVDLSLDDVEHAKVRRFGDPRVHGALVCGSVSCPTLRGEPYRGADLDGQLDDQMRFFLSNGGAVADPADNVVHLSRVLQWFGSDFVRPAKMPTFVPSRSRRVLRAIRPWLTDDVRAMADAGAGVEYQSYDWGLRCAVA